MKATSGNVSNKKRIITELEHFKKTGESYTFDETFYEEKNTPKK